MLILYSFLLIAGAYLAGCILGCFARRIFGQNEEPRYISENNVLSNIVASSGAKRADKGQVSPSKGRRKK